MRRMYEIFCTAFPTRDAYALVESLFCAKSQQRPIFLFQQNVIHQIRFPNIFYSSSSFIVFFCSNGADATQQTFTMSHVSALTIKIKLTLMNKSPEGTA